MPVTFNPANHPAEPFSAQSLAELETSSKAFLEKVRSGPEHDPRIVQELLQSSFPKTYVELDTLSRHNGFVDTVIEAYNHHHALTIRPDDVWLAILTQFSIFVNNNAEALRASFVAHEGKKTLQIHASGTRYTVDFGAFAQQFTHLIDENVVDPSLRKWILPDFSTTRANDTTICAVVMMATMKTYFSYEIHLRCGIPRITLEGTKDDWEKILQRLEKLKEYGLQTIAWYHLLRPIISRFVAAFDDPGSEANKAFWGRVAHYIEGGSGPDWRAGWITAFCTFNTASRPDKQWQGRPFKEDIPHLAGGPQADIEKAAALPPAEFFDTYTDPLPPTLRMRMDGDVEDVLVLDGVPYPRIKAHNVPPGFAEVDVLLDDNGVKFETAMVAGSVGIQVYGEGSEAAKDAVAPVSGWWMYVKPDELALPVEGKGRGGRGRRRLRRPTSGPGSAQPSD